MRQSAMKQSELNRELRRLAKAEAKNRGWKCVDGFMYWTTGPLFFVVLQTARAKNASFHVSLAFKWLSLDRILWRILGMSSNENEPFSVHANGAFVLTGQEILKFSNGDLVWSPGVLKEQVEEAAGRSEQRASEVAGQISSIHSYLDFIQREHEEFMQRFPEARVNVWKEALLVAIETNDLATAAEIARSRIAARDSGGFASMGKSFYERALAFAEA